MSNFFKRKSFTVKEKQTLLSLYALSALSVQDAPNILIRINTQNLSADKNDPIQSNFDDIDTFVLTTSANSDNTIVYTSPKDFVNLNVTDGGFF